MKELNIDMVLRARAALNSQAVPDPAYVASGRWLYQMGDSVTFSDDNGKTFHDWDDNHPACQWWAGLWRDVQG